MNTSPVSSFSISDPILRDGGDLTPGGLCYDTSGSSDMDSVKGSPVPDCSPLGAGMHAVAEAEMTTPTAEV